MELFKKKTKIPLVIAINQVDNLGVGWNNKINLPMDDAQKAIEQRVRDIIKKLSLGSSVISTDQIEYYSALRAFRMHEILKKLSKYAKSGTIIPCNPIRMTNKVAAKRGEDGGMPEDVAAAIDITLDAMDEQFAKFTLDKIVEQLKGQLESEEDREVLINAWKQKKAETLRIGVIGKAGVGKTTTVNSLFQAQFVTSRTVVGTHRAQYKDFKLPDGGSLTIVDMPGYGRSIADDREYRDIYLNELPKCDIILMIVQANSSDLYDDQMMIKHLDEWVKAGFIKYE